MMLPLLTALSLLPGVADAASPPKTEYSLRLANYSIQTEDYRFPSGLRILFQEDHTQPIVSVTNWFDRGSIYDGVGVNGKSVEGIAHAVEHLAFRARHGDLPKNWDVINQLGGVLNASTSTDWTNYMTVAPVDATIPLMRIEAMRMVDGVAGVTQEDVDSEKFIVRNELRMGYEMGSNGSPEIRTALLHLPKLLYPADHPYRNSTIGSHDTIMNISLADVQRFVRENYRPEYSTIAVVGDLDLSKGQGMRMIFEAFADHEELLMAPEDAAKYKALTDPAARNKFMNDWMPKLEAHLRKTFEEPAKPRTACDARPEPPPRQSAEIMKIQGMVEKPTAIVAWSLPGGYCSDDPVANVAANMLTNYVGYTLDSNYDPLSQESEVDDFGCFAMQDRINSVVVCMVVQGAMSSDTPERLVEKVGDALYLQWNPIDPVMKPFYDRSQTFSRLYGMSGLLGQTDNVASLYGRSFFVAQHAHYTGSAAFFSDNINQTNAVNFEDARALAKKYLTRDRMVGLVITPMDEEERERLEASASEADSKADSSGQHRAKDDKGRQLFDTNKLTPEAIKRVTVVPPVDKAKRLVLDNGLEVVILKHGEAPLVKVGLQVDGSGATAPQPGLDALAEQVYATAVQSNNNPTENPLAVAGQVYRDGNMVYASGSSGNLDALLHKVRWNVEEYDWFMAEKGGALKSWTNGVKKDGRKPETWAGRIRMERLFPEHPYGKWMTPADYAALEGVGQSDLAAWVYKKWQPANARLVVVGNVDQDEAEKLVKEYFAEWKAKEGVQVGQIAPPAAPTKQPDRTVLLFDKPIGTQSKVQLSCQLKFDGPQHEARTQVLGEILTFLAFEKLREEKGLTYGAYAFPRRYWGDTTELIISSVIQNSGAGFGVETMLKLVEDGAAGRFDEGLIRTNQWNVGRTSVTNLQSGDQMLSALLAPGRGKLDYYKNYPDYLGGVDKAGIQDALSRCAGHEVVTVVGPVDQVKPQLDKANIKYEVIDWEPRQRALLSKKELKAWDKAKAKEAEKKAAAAAAPAAPSVASAR